MSTTAEDISTTLSDGQRPEPSVDSTDEIANLLAGDIESDEEDGKGDENQTDLSTLSEDEKNQLGDAADDKDDKKSDIDGNDDELSWGSVLGVGEDQLSFDNDGNLAGVIVKVNGESEVLPVSDLIAGYQTNKAVTTKGQGLAEERKAFDVKKEQVQQVYASKLESVDALVTHFEKQLIAEYDKIDWNILRQDNPAEYAAAKSDFAEKATEVQRIQAAVKKDKDAQIAEAQEAQSAAQKIYIKQQFDTMIVNNPEWTDEKVRNTAQGEFKSFVTENYGFTDQEFETVFDARLIELIKDAKRFHDAAKVSDKKRQKPVPKFQKSVGGKKKAAPTQLDKLTAASKKANGAAKRDLQTSAVAELLIG